MSNLKSSRWFPFGIHPPQKNWAPEQPWWNRFKTLALTLWTLVICHAYFWLYFSLLNYDDYGVTLPFLQVILRPLYDKLLKKIPVSTVKKNNELLPGGDLRATQNAWVRSAWVASGLQKVPREKTIKLIVRKLVRKLKLCPLDIWVWCLF